MSIRGRLAYKWFFKPKADLLKSWQNLRTFGFQRDHFFKKFNHGCEAAMPLALSRLLALNQLHNDCVNVYYLGSNAFFPLISYSLISLARVTTLPLRFHMLPDKNGYSQALVEQFQNSQGVMKFYNNEDIRVQLDTLVPIHQFPNLRELHNRLILARKLIDFNLLQPGYKIFIDADTIFWRQPDEMMTLCLQERAFAQEDFQDSYVFPKAEVETICAREFRSRVNTGLIGLSSNKLDWERLEFYCKRILQKLQIGQNIHFLEQTLYALLFSELDDFTLLPTDKYIVMPSAREARRPRAVFHHYVVPCRHLFYRHGWKRILEG